MKDMMQFGVFLIGLSSFFLLVERLMIDYTWFASTFGAFQGFLTAFVVVFPLFMSLGVIFILSPLFHKHFLLLLIFFVIFAAIFWYMSIGITGGL